MNFLRRYFQGWDFWVSTAVAVLLGLSALALASADGGSAGREMLTQGIAVGIGLILAFVIALVHPKTIHRLRHPAALAAILVLVAVLIFGRTVKGTRGWFMLGSATLQPVEFAKIALLIVLASILPIHARLRSLTAVIGASAITAVFVVLVLLQPDFGSAMILIGLWGMMLLVSGLPRRYVLGLFLAAVTVAVLAWVFALKPYQKDRVFTFLDPSRDPYGRGYNVTQAQIAVGSGGFWGAGFASGSQSQLRFLPERQSDFVFSLVAEEFGFAGVIVLLGSFGIIIWRLFLLVRRSPDDFSQFLVVGTAALISIEAVIAVGGNIGILPMTGITLPFVSAGGSSVMAHLCLLGLVESVSRAALRSGTSRSAVSEG